MILVALFCVTFRIEPGDNWRMDKHNTTEQPSISDSREWCQSKRDTARNSVQRRTHHNRKTLTRIVMDEVDVSS
jgi:hypothetical protein